METSKFKIADILYGLVIPIILALLVYVLAIYVNPTGTQHVLGNGTDIGSTIAVIFTQGFAQMIVLGVPLVLGLLWNKWAGGAAGFIMGGIYYVASAGEYNGQFSAMGATMVSVSVPITNDTMQGILNGSITSLAGSGYGSQPYNYYGDISVLFWIVNAVIIGYIAGSLSGGSTNFKRMLGAGLTASITVAVIQTLLNYYVSLAPSSAMAQSLWATDIGQAILINFLPSILLGVIIPIIAKVMTWYGLQPMKH
jgi:hypothetical protein